MASQKLMEIEEVAQDLSEDSPPTPYRCDHTLARQGRDIQSQLVRKNPQAHCSLACQATIYTRPSTLSTEAIETLQRQICRVQVRQ